MKKTRQIKIGSILIGGGAPVSIQSMTNTPTSDADATIAQIKALSEAGCQIARLTVPDEKSVQSLSRIIEESPLPIIADIHFDYRLAIASIKAGVHAVRINPGNIGSVERAGLVAEAAGKAGIPIRVGANSGSLPKGLLESKMASGMSREKALADSLVEAAFEQVKILESFSFTNIKVSLKASSVPVTVAAYKHFAGLSDYPLHIGVTEAGTVFRGTVKSSVGIGALLLDGIGDTMRVSLSASPVEEIKVAKAILEAAGLRESAPEIVSCPTCGRTAFDLISMAGKVENLVDSMKAAGVKINMRKIAVMGCIVNGPGEASDADIGIAGGGDSSKIVLFKFGKPVATLPEKEAFEALRAEIEKTVVR